MKFPLLLLVAVAVLGGTVGCVGPGYPGGGGVAVGTYSEPYYGGYGPYYGDTILFGSGNYHRGYYGNHHFSGGGFARRAGGRGSGGRGGAAGFGGGHGGGSHAGAGFGGGHGGGGGHR